MILEEQVQVEQKQLKLNRYSFDIILNNLI